MGEVYRADDLKLGQAVALKFLPKAVSGDEALLARFHAEVRLARQVSHPNVCRIYDIGEIEGRHFLSMEYVDGEDLASLLKRIGHLPVQKAVDIARQLCAGLHAAHEKGVLHRDLKPANVMLDGRGRVRITDFGLAVAAEEAASVGEVSGTPAYMAPEQLAGKPASVQERPLRARPRPLRGRDRQARVRRADARRDAPQARAGAAHRAVDHPRGLRPGRRARDPALSREGPARAAFLRSAGRGRTARRRSARRRARCRRDAFARDGRGRGARRGHPDRRARRRSSPASSLSSPPSSSSRAGATDLGLSPLPKPPDALRGAGARGRRAASATRIRRRTRAARSRVTPRTSSFRARTRRSGLGATLARAGGSPRPSTTARAQGRSFPPNVSIVRLADPPLNVTGMVTVILDPEGRLREFVAVPPQVPPSCAGVTGRADVGRSSLGSGPRPEKSFTRSPSRLATERAFRRDRGIHGPDARGKGRDAARRRGGIPRPPRLVSARRPVERAGSRRRGARDSSIAHP